MRFATTSVAPNRSLLGRMSPSERAAGRFMRNPDEHTPAPAPIAPPVETPEPAPAPVEPSTAPSDTEAKLLKETMKQKAAARAAQEQLDAANARLAAYGDATPEEIATYRAERAAAEQAAAEARGEYDRVLESIRTQAEAREAALAAQAQTAEERLAEAQTRIDDLTVGRAFGDSKFLSLNTVLSPSKARKLYGDHFDVVDGDFVAYDKPKGAKNRTPLVDARGDNLSFEAAIEKIVKADPDYETIGRSKIKSGSGSTPAAVAAEEPRPSVGPGKSRMAAALAARKAK